MGDRAYCQIEIAAAHKAQLEDILEEYGFQVQDDGDFDGRVIFEDSEANYGGQEALEAVNGTKLPYIGYHDSGGCYGAALFAGDGAETCECSGADGRPLCSVEDDGEPDPQSLATARAYLRIKANAERLMGEANGIMAAFTTP